MQVAAAFALGKGILPGEGGAMMWFNGALHTKNPASALMMALQQEMQAVQVRTAPRAAASVPAPEPPGAGPEA